jgi:hypothetical protein
VINETSKEMFTVLLVVFWSFVCPLQEEETVDGADFCYTLA